MAILFKGYLLLIVLSAALLAGNNSWMEIEPALGRISLDSDFLDGNSMALGLSVYKPVTERWISGLAYKYAGFSQNFSMPDGNKSYKYNVNIFQVKSKYRLFTLSKMISLLPEIGLGAISIHQPSILVKLGAQGERKISAKTSNYMAYSVNLNINWLTTKRLSITISPGIFMFNQASTSYYNYSIDGGINIALY